MNLSRLMQSQYRVPLLIIAVLLVILVIFEIWLAFERESPKTVLQPPAAALQEVQKILFATKWSSTGLFPQENFPTAHIQPECWAFLQSLPDTDPYTSTITISNYATLAQPTPEIYVNYRFSDNSHVSFHFTAGNIDSCRDFGGGK